MPRRTSSSRYSKKRSYKKAPSRKSYKRRYAPTTSKARRYVKATRSYSGSSVPRGMMPNSVYNLPYQQSSYQSSSYRPEKIPGGTRKEPAPNYQEPIQQGGGPLDMQIERFFRENVLDPVEAQVRAHGQQLLTGVADVALTAALAELGPLAPVAGAIGGAVVNRAMSYVSGQQQPSIMGDLQNVATAAVPFVTDVVMGKKGPKKYVTFEGGESPRPSFQQSPISNFLDETEYWDRLHTPSNTLYSPYKPPVRGPIEYRDFRSAHEYQLEQQHHRDQVRDYKMKADFSVPAPVDITKRWARRPSENQDSPLTKTLRFAFEDLPHAVREDVTSYASNTLSKKLFSMPGSQPTNNTRKLLESLAHPDKDYIFLDDDHLSPGLSYHKQSPYPTRFRNRSVSTFRLDDYSHEKEVISTYRL